MKTNIKYINTRALYDKKGTFMTSKKKLGLHIMVFQCNANHLKHNEVEVLLGLTSKIDLYQRK